MSQITYFMQEMQRPEDSNTKYHHKVDHLYYDTEANAVFAHHIDTDTNTDVVKLVATVSLEDGYDVSGTYLMSTIVTDVIDDLEGSNE